MFQSFDVAGDNRGTRFVYNTRGYLSTLREARGGTAGRVYWTVQAHDPRGQMTRAQMGNGMEVNASYDPATGLLEYRTDGNGSALAQDLELAWDAMGNLAWRHDRGGMRDQREWFDYDSRDRMWQVRRQIGFNPVQTVQRLRYDVSGNILCKSDLPGWGSSCASGTPDNYSYASARPHAATTAGNRTFTFDANGNVTIDRVNGVVDRQFDYANFDKIRRIRRGGDAVEFHYGADRARTLKVGRNYGVFVWGSASGIHAIVWRSWFAKLAAGSRSSRSHMSNQSIGLSADIQRYVLDHSLREHELLAELRAETARLAQANMQIAPEQGQFMALLARTIGARRYLDVGTFTGYSALAVVLAMPDSGRATCLDISREWTDIAQKYWIRAGVNDRIDLTLAPASESLDALIRDGWSGDYDMAFIDADKTGYADYYEACLTLIRPGGLVLVDNTLWGGSVADAGVDDEDTRAIREFNERVHADDRVDLSLVPIGDGLTIARKRV